MSSRMPARNRPSHGALQALDVGAIRRWAVLVRAAIGARRKQIDALNVFPVPDGDTGTNLFLTVDGAIERLLEGERDSEAPEVQTAASMLESWARALQWSARGNSGVILSQLALGLSVAARGCRVIGAEQIRAGIRLADERAWAAVAEPKEGTILSVSRSAALAVTEAPPDVSLHELSVIMRDGALSALERTTDQLDVLRRAGVVDAGGAGLLVVLACLERICSGDDARAALTFEIPGQVPTSPPVGVVAEHEGPEYEVMYHLSGPDAEAAAGLRARLVTLGDSVLVVGEEPDWTVHAHVDDIGAAIEAAVEVGRPSRIRVTRLVDVTQEPVGVVVGVGLGQPGDHAEDSTAPGASMVRHETGVVACVAGPGLAQLFAEYGAITVDSGPGRRASTGSLFAAITRAHDRGARAVLVLPNDKDTQLAAGVAVDAARQDGIAASLVASRTAVQGVAAIAVFDPDAPLEANTRAMQEAASATRHGGVTVANRDALTSGGPCAIGDALGVVDGDIVVVGTDLAEVANDVIQRLLAGGGELVTLLIGHGASTELVQSVRDEVARLRRDVEVTVVNGGQEVYPLLVGVE